MIKSREPISNVGAEGKGFLGHSLLLLEWWCWVHLLLTYCAVVSSWAFWCGRGPQESFWFSFHWERVLMLFFKKKHNTHLCRRPGFDPGVGKIWRRAWPPPPEFLPGEFPMDRGAWRATVHGVARVRHDWGTEHTRTRTK